ncbi:AraC family transcriptional regulator [Clostridia bacterium]|nr:AraC family transcriptional regulator [Clostridia bacterium]
MKDKISEITNYMREHTDREISVEELADRFGYSKFHFSREFKKLIGVTPNEYWGALKMERSLVELSRSSSILQGQLNTGYQSTGTFSSAFLKSTGFTPGQYQEEMKKLSLYKATKEFEQKEKSVITHYAFNKRNPATVQNKKLFVTCHMPEGFKGIIFVGLFLKPFSSQVPILGKALLKTNQCIIDRIPNGDYYPMACSIRSSMNPFSYFHLDKQLRDLHRTPLRFPLETDTEISFTLREILPTDPAISFSPIKLLINALKRKK